MRTLAGAAIAGARKVYHAAAENAPLRANATLEAVGGTALYLASDLGACTTGEIIFVDGGYHALGMAQPPQPVRVALRAAPRRKAGGPPEGRGPTRPPSGAGGCAGSARLNRSGGKGAGYDSGGGV